MDEKTMLILSVILIVFGSAAIYSNIRKQLRYKEEGIETIVALDHDNRLYRTLVPFVIVFIVLAAGAIVYNTLVVEKAGIMDIWYLLTLPIIVIILYFPMTRKTKITTLGIFKKNNLIPWETIKKIEYKYSKPNKKGTIQAQIFYTESDKELNISVKFSENDKQFPIFKDKAAEYHRINKKKNN